MPELPNIQQNNEQILNDIQSLQQMEQQLFNNLESNPNLTPEEQEKIINKMNQLSDMRINLYKTLSGVNNYFQKALDTSIGSLQEQTIAIGIVEDELNRAKNRLQVLEEEKNNKIRLVEINTYFGDKYAEHSQLMKIIIYTLVPIIIIVLLNNNGILPNFIYYILMVIIVLIGSYFFWTRYASIITRDNMNYEEYDWYFNPESAPSGSSSITDPWKTDVNLGTCIGQACCSDGQVYDSKLDKCIVSIKPKAEPFTTQTDNINNVLTKTQQGKYKTDYNLKQPDAFNNMN